jgi:hypothetical protein
MAALLARLSASWMARVTSGLSSLVGQHTRLRSNSREKSMPDSKNMSSLCICQGCGSVLIIYGCGYRFHPDSEAQKAEIFREKTCKIVFDFLIFGTLTRIKQLE